MTKNRPPRRARTTTTTTTTVNLLLVLLLALVPFAPGASAQRRQGQRTRPPVVQSGASAASARPRLVLLIAIDQFRYDFLERFGDLFTATGIGRLTRGGASWAEAHYDHTPTETAPGHATMMTGAWPSETGIIANEWFDRESNKRINNVGDETVRKLGGGERDRAASPRNLLASTVGDQLKLATNGRAKVVGISSKDRSAILPAGRMADGAYWYSSQTGEFVSSTYYFERLPDWVARFNAAKPADKFFGAKWERLLPAAEYERRAGADDAPWEKDGRTPHTFPYTINGGLTAPGPAFYGAVDASPYSNDLIVSLAEQAVINERMGEDADTDVLTVSFSANDIVGHRYGPYSHETMDMVVRVDRQIGRLLDFIESRVGLRNTVVAFTADHGVALSPEHAAAVRLPGGRVRTTDILNAIRNRIRVRYGKQGDNDTTADYVSAFSNGQVYFNWFALERDGIRREEIEQVAGEAALTVPGVSRFYTRTQLLTSSTSPADSVARRVMHGFHPKRSGDVVVIQDAFKYMADYTVVATHGAPYAYDTHVPVIIMGAGLNPGLYRTAASPADIAPTLTRLLGVQGTSNAVGRVLTEAFR